MNNKIIVYEVTIYLKKLVYRRVTYLSIQDMRDFIKKFESTHNMDLFSLSPVRVLNIIG